MVDVFSSSVVQALVHLKSCVKAREWLNALMALCLGGSAGGAWVLVSVTRFEQSMSIWSQRERERERWGGGGGLPKYFCKYLRVNKHRTAAETDSDI